MKACSVIKKLRIVAGTVTDYEQLAHYHYREGRPTGITAIYAIKSSPAWASATRPSVAGVVMYTLPSPFVQLRNVATDNIFAGFDRRTRLALLNRHVRCISRVIIEPRFRGLGLASKLVRETMPKLDVPIVEAMAVMGMVNPFLEKAGMKAYPAKSPERCATLIEAFSAVGIEESQLIDPKLVQRKVNRLSASKAEFIERQIESFVQSYGRRRDMPAGADRTRYVLTKLTCRPIYYIWFNPKHRVWRVKDNAEQSSVNCVG
ncbi:MAG: hypothetical protein JSU70_18330 [Phycisphaerales bacterium]|nr:MAG: hypothetical protein JSU70_18330 [Phycisphaerales bacterium]